MKFAKRLLIGVGAFALAGVIAAVLAPNTAHAVVSTLVTVANPASQPVFTMGVDNPDQSPLRFSSSLTVPPGVGAAGDFLFTVPAGKRMVVEFVSVICPIPASSGVGVANILFTTGENVSQGIVFHNYPLALMKSPTDFSGVVIYYVSQPLRLYSDGSAFDSVGGTVLLTGAAPQNGVQCTYEVSGHTANMP